MSIQPLEFPLSNTAEQTQCHIVRWWNQWMFFCMNDSAEFWRGLCIVFALFASFGQRRPRFNILRLTNKFSICGVYVLEIRLCFILTPNTPNMDESARNIRDYHAISVCVSWWAPLSLSASIHISISDGWWWSLREWVGVLVKFLCIYVLYLCISCCQSTLKRSDGLFGIACDVVAGNIQH